MVEFKEIEKRVGKVPIDEILKDVNWKEFEGVVAEIFSKNDFCVKKNFRFKTRNRHEIDILARRGSFLVLVDCKQWLGGRYKKSGLKKAVKVQEKRTRSLKKFLKRNPIASQMLRISSITKIHALIVTLMDEDIYKERKTFIIPIFKLNSFLLELENYLS